MVALLSSPMTATHPTGRYDLFDQPSSPSFKHQELPVEFGDQSFGSSMSLGSSFELNRIANGASSVLNRSVELGHSEAGGTVRQAARKSPPRTAQDGLGAAMGTILNSKSPGLAAKMSSPHYMDMSPLPPKGTPHLGHETPLKAGRTSGRASDEYDEDLPPGSAMKEDTPVTMKHPSTIRRNEDTVTQGGSLGRLFGTELSLNQKSNNPSNRASAGCVFSGNGVPISDDSFNSPDKEPPAKRRPASLPLSHGNPQARPSLRAAGLAPASSTSNTMPRPRPNLLKSMTTGHATETRDRRTSFDALRQLNRASDSAVPTVTSFGLGRTSRSRAGSTERSDGKSLNGERGSQKSSLPPPLHPTIIESPSPSKANDGLAGYFFDPQSPDMQRSSGTSSTSSSQQHQSSFASVALASSRPRVMEKAASSAVIPTMTGSSLLGKRANPYAKRNQLASSHASNEKAANLLGVPGSSPSRSKIPAPRRCQSALDNSAAFMMAGAAMAAANEDMSLSSIDGDCSVDASPSVARANQKTTIRLPPGFDASGSPIAPSARNTTRPNLFRRPSKDDSSPLGYGKRFAAVNDVDNEGSPRAARTSGEHLPGFGASEREGKILPCFSVKDDGLMRITADTLLDVLAGNFDERMDGFQIVDCRFGYEFDGGHIRGAINLSTLDKVKKHFLQPNASSSLPARTQSGKPDQCGRLRKKVLIFHCEFSLKRAPSSALALRQADRSLAHDYPSCHYPEVYVLQGGYSGFYERYAHACEPQAYIPMDDPKFQARRSIELNGFRKQFSRHRSFTYGDERQSQSDGMLPQHRQQQCANGLAVPSALSRTIKEEDSSFENSGSSPSTLQAEAALARRRGLVRHATDMCKLGSAPAAGPPANRTNAPLGIKPVLSSRLNDDRPAPTSVGDLSFGSCCSIGDDTSTSFEGGLSDSPCAVAASAGPSRRLPALAPGAPVGQGQRRVPSTASARFTLAPTR